MICRILLVVCFCFFFLNKYNSMSLIRNLNSNVTEVENDTVVMFFGDSLTAEKLSIGNINDFSWTLTNDNTFISGNGDELYNLPLQTPGLYTLDLKPGINLDHSHNEECNHTVTARKIEINTLPYSIDFQFTKSKFSKTIKADVETEGTTFNIPISISLYEIKTVSFDKIKLVSSGVNTTIIGELVDLEKNYSSGKNNLTFNLKGKASANTYIMFDIYNGEKLISTYYYPNKITN